MCGIALAAGIGIFLIPVQDGIVRQLASDVVALLMIAAVLCICKMLSERREVPRGTVLTQTYAIFILSWPCQLAVEVALERLLGMPIWVVMPAMLLTGIAVPPVLLTLLDRFEARTKTKFLSAVLGR